MCLVWARGIDVIWELWEPAHTGQYDPLTGLYAKHAKDKHREKAQKQQLCDINVNYTPES